MLGTDIFKMGRSTFTNLCIRNRHIIPGNIIIAIQSIMSVPKTIRLNANLIALFEFANKNTILDDIYPTMSAFITEEQFNEMVKQLHEINLSKVIEMVDNTARQDELACAGGSCEVV